MCCSYILTAARLIAPVVERSGPVLGFDWCMEALTAAQHSGLASEVALAKAGWFLDHQAFGDAVSVLKVRRLCFLLDMYTSASICYMYFADDRYAMRLRSLKLFGCCFMLHSVSCTLV